jgi:hypothetical protein
MLEQVRDPSRGIPAFVTFGHVPPALGRGLQPEQVEHAQLGITWDVTDILDYWQHPRARRVDSRAGDPHEMVAAEGLRPLPGRPAERGDEPAARSRQI